MNKKRNIVMILTLGIVALMLTTGWNVLAQAAWPPDSMSVYSLAGAWLQTVDTDPTDAIDIVTISPEDPRSGKGFCIATDINPDFTANGLWPDAESWTPWNGAYVRTGSDTWQVKCVSYVRKDTKPKPTVLHILILEGTWTMTAPDTVEFIGDVSIYDADQDGDDDGLPDEGQQPKMAMPVTGYMKSL